MHLEKDSEIRAVELCRNPGCASVAGEMYGCIYVAELGIPPTVPRNRSVDLHNTNLPICPGKVRYGSTKLRQNLGGVDMSKSLTGLVKGA